MTVVELASYAAVMDLLLQIARCPNVQACLGSRDRVHDCTEIVLSQGSETLAEHQVPEPWSGHLEEALLLFLSSNPSIDASEDNPGDYPRWSWPDHWIADFFANRFGRGRKPWVRDGLYPLRQDGTHYKEWVRFWAAVRRRAVELLMRDDVRPGLDYALSEVVHCKSFNEVGVGRALEECANRYLGGVVCQAGAQVVVTLGRFAGDALRRTFQIPQDAAVHGPIQVGDRRRYFAFLPHPNARRPRSFAKCLSSEDLRRLQEFLRTGGKGAA